MTILIMPDDDILELENVFDAHVECLLRALALRNVETAEHTRRVAALTVNLAQALEVPESELIHIRRGAMLHDIGKIGIPDMILNKDESLTLDELNVLHMHPVYAYELLQPISYLQPALDIPYCHHEKWDGTGYPRQLMGNQIPFFARLFAIVDVWDALLSNRPYRPAWSVDQVIEYVIEQDGKHFDPEVVAVFLAKAIPIISAQKHLPGVMP